MASTTDILARAARALRPGTRRRLAARLGAVLDRGQPGDTRVHPAHRHASEDDDPPEPSARVRAIRSRDNPVILDRRDRFVFFPNSKVAQRSIARDLLADRVIVRKDDPRAWEARFAHLDDAYFARTFSFTVVRNPFDRVVSAFFYLRDRCAGYEFNDFVVDVLGREGPSFDPHFAPQADGLFHDGALLVEHVGRFETLERAWREIATRIDAPATLPHRGRSKRSASYAGYYGDEARRVVERLYHDDLERFGYAFHDERRTPPRAARHAER